MKMEAFDIFFQNHRQRYTVTPITTVRGPLVCLCPAKTLWRYIVGYTFGNSQHNPEVLKFFSRPTQLSTKFILLINVKMPTIVGILTFISMMNTTAERFKARIFPVVSV